MRYRFFWVAALLVSLSIPGIAQAATVEGQVHARRSRYQKNVVVYVEAIEGKTFKAPEKHVLMDQKNLVFLPHILPVQVGTSVDFQNSDDVLHNVMSPDKVADKFNLGTWPKGEKRSHTFDKLGAAVILCNVHPEMEAFVVVLPTPYFAKTDKEGNFKIENVPAGKYTLKIWQEKKMVAEPQQVTIPEKGDVTVEFTLKRK